MVQPTSLALVVSSIASPLGVTSPTGAGWLRLLTNKHEESTLEAFKEYKAMDEAQLLCAD